MKATIKVQQIANVNLQLSLQEVEEIRDALGKMNWLEMKRVMPSLTDNEQTVLFRLYNELCDIKLENNSD